MKAVFSDDQRNHYPEHFLVNGVMAQNPERPERIDHLLAGVQRAGLALEALFGSLQ